MSTAITLTPRYGRDYTSAAKVREAWAEGKDFTVADFFSPWDGAAVSIRESNTLLDGGRGEVHIRYKKLMNVVVIRLARQEAGG